MNQSEKPKRGDLIEIYRSFYQHWAVYVGDGLIVHFAPPPEVAGAGASSVMSVFAPRAAVKKEKLSDAVGTDDWRVNNCLDEDYEPHQTDVIAMEALELVGTEQPYALLTWNCEHFAKNLRYGIAESRQARKAAMITGGVAAAGVILGGVALVAALAARGENEDDSDSDSEAPEVQVLQPNNYLS